MRMKHAGFFRHLTGYSMMAVMACACLCGCGRGKERATVKIVTEDVSDRYDLALAELRDVELVKRLDCTYSQLKEEKLSFAIDGLKVAHVYVEEGQDVKAGDLVAELDVADLEKEVYQMSASVRESELKIKQENEMIEYYNSRINSPAVSLADKEQYILSRENSEEKLIEYNKMIDYYNKKIEKDNQTISLSGLYAGMDGTVLSIKEDIDDWVSNKTTVAMTIVDASVCAFQTSDKEAADYLKIGDKAEVNVGNDKSYPVTVSSIDSETGKVFFELDEPDFSLTMGASGSINVLLDRREQVLSLPRVTVYNTDDYYYVFELTDNGVREMKKVEVGLIGNDYVEIKSGLELNSAVILRMTY